MTAIGTVTQGDFDYIDEWIQYHLNIGIELIFVAYNGDAKNFGNLPKYDRVIYLDFSYNTNVPATDYLHSTFENHFSAMYESDVADIWMTVQQKIQNVILYICLLCYRCLSFLIIMDTDEFIILKNGYDNVDKFLMDTYNREKPSIQIQWQFYSDNNLIWKDERSVMERFYNDSNAHAKDNISHMLGERKPIIYLHHAEVQNHNIIMCSPHFVRFTKDEDRYEKSDIELAHFFTKSLEEWISKLDTRNDTIYFERFRGEIFARYFMYNKMTDEKLQAIPRLLKKHNIEYKPEIEEKDQNFVENYKRANNIS